MLPLRWVLAALVVGTYVTYLGLASIFRGIPLLNIHINLVIVATLGLGIHAMWIDHRNSRRHAHILERLEAADTKQIILTRGELAEIRRELDARDGLLYAAIARITGRCETLRADVSNRFVLLESTQELPTAAVGQARGTATIVSVTERAGAGQPRRRPRRSRRSSGLQRDIEAEMRGWFARGDGQTGET